MMLPDARRAVVTWEGPGEPVVLTLYGPDGEKVTMPLAPKRALALAQEPDILLLDEPTQQLDITRQAEILDLVVDLNRSRGLTVLCAIHDLNLAAGYFHRLIVLHNGSLLADGPPAEVLRPELLEIAYDGPVEVVSIENRSAPVVLAASRTRDGSSKGEKPER